MHNQRKRVYWFFFLFILGFFITSSSESLATVPSDLTIKLLQNKLNSNQKNFFPQIIEKNQFNNIYSNSNKTNNNGSTPLSNALSNVKEIGSGSNFSCAINDEGKLYCWGNNEYGQLGDNTYTNSTTPHLIYDNGSLTGTLAGENVTSVNIGRAHTCAINNSGTLYCWGYGYYGQIGNGSTSDSSIPSPVNIDELGTTPVAKSVSVGWEHTCAIYEINGDDKLYCWGNNGSGQLGDGDTNQGQLKPAPVNTDGLLGGFTIKNVSAGGSHTCAINSDDRLYCWGNNYYGQMGDSTTYGQPVPVPSLINGTGLLGGTTVKSVSTYYNHTCAINNDDNLYCWGNNSNGQIGVESYGNPVSTPNLVENNNIGKFISVSTGYQHTCAIGSNEKPYCWGYGTYGQLGDGSSVDNPIPSPVNTDNFLGEKSIRSISAGDYHTCAIDSENKLFCWGSCYLNNSIWPSISSGALKAPLPIYDEALKLRHGTIFGLDINEEISNHTSVSTGGAHTCAIDSEKKLYCWGLNVYGQLGDGSDDYRKDKPTIIESNDTETGLRFNTVSADDNHTCAINNSGTLYCWGRNDNGQLGDGSYDSYKNKPTKIESNDTETGLRFNTVSAGYSHTCAIDSREKLYCWGYNGSGQLGNGSIGDILWKPTPVDIDEVGINPSAKSVSTGYYHTCAIFEIGSIENRINKLFCWGSDSQGQLGDDEYYTDKPSPTPVNTSEIGTDPIVKSVSVKTEHTCAIFEINDEDKLYCWGYGTIPLPTLVDTSSIDGNPTIIKVSAGDGYDCAIIKTNNKNKLFCWGLTTYGKLGNGDDSGIEDLTLYPVIDNGLLGGQEVIGVSAGYNHTCAINNDNKLYCWGLNTSGECTKNSSFTSLNTSIPNLISASPCIANSKNYEIGASCSDGDGICSRTGTYQCSSVDLLEIDCVGTIKYPNPNGEICSNELDDNCDGTKDESPCLGNNCSSDVNYELIDTVCSAGIGACMANGVYYCDTTEDKVKCNAVAGSGGDELCNGIDDNCDGETDENFDIGETCTVGLGACERTGVKICANDTLSTICNVEAGTAGIEICNDNIDNDCDGETDEITDCQCLDQESILNTQCSVGLGQCNNTGEYICNKTTGAIVCNVAPLPAGVESCDNMGSDDDCDGILDNVPNLNTSCEGESVGTGICANSTGTYVCSGNNLICQVTPLPAGVESCDNMGSDDDCDGVLDNIPNLNTSCEGESVGAGICANSTGTYICSGDNLICQITPLPAGIESCDNMGSDDDCDGEIDNGFLEVSGKCYAKPDIENSDECNTSDVVINSHCYNPEDYNKQDHWLDNNIQPLPAIVTPTNTQGKIEILMEKYTINPKMKKRLQKRALKKLGIKNAKLKVYYNYIITQLSDSTDESISALANKKNKKKQKIIKKTIRKNQTTEKNLPAGQYKIEYKITVYTMVNKKPLLTWGNQKSNKLSPPANFTIQKK